MFPRRQMAWRYGNDVAGAFGRRYGVGAWHARGDGGLRKRGPAVEAQRPQEVPQGAYLRCPCECLLMPLFAGWFLRVSRSRFCLALPCLPLPCVALPCLLLRRPEQSDPGVGVDRDQRTSFSVVVLAGGVFVVVDAFTPYHIIVFSVSRAACYGTRTSLSHGNLSSPNLKPVFVV